MTPDVAEAYAADILPPEQEMGAYMGDSIITPRGAPHLVMRRG